MPHWDKAAADASAAEFGQKLSVGMTHEQIATLWREHFMTAGHRRLADALVAFWRKAEFAGWGKSAALQPAKMPE